MEISTYCFQCKKYNTDKFVNDMQDIKPNCFEHKKCGECDFAESIDGRNEIVGCTKMNILKSTEDDCCWNGN